MAGGTWSTTERSVLPGLYMNFQAAAASSIQAGSRGTVVIPVKANWGPIGEFVEIGSEASIERIYADAESDDATVNVLRMALLGGPRKLVAYRMADAKAAAASVTLKSAEGNSVLELEAKYAGSRGNRFNVTVQAEMTDSKKRALRVFEDGKLLRTFISSEGTAESFVKIVQEDPGNIWLNASVQGEGGVPEDATGLFLNGGASGNSGLTNADYVAAQAALESREFDVLALDHAAEMPLLQSFAAWIKRIRGEGKNVLAVFGTSAADDISAQAPELAAVRSRAFNNEGIVNVATGVVRNGKAYDSATTAAYAAGLIAGQRLNESTTYAPAPFEDVTRRWSRSEQEQAIQDGTFVFIHDGRRVKALRGINTLNEPAAGQNNAWKKIRSIRVMDAINSDLRQAAEDHYIGKVNNTAEGRQALIGAMKQYLVLLSQSGVIERDSFDVKLDPAYYGPSPVLQPEADQVFLQWNAKLTDVMEQLFGTFYVQ